ncbi:hypothetical protein D1609_12300 [Leptospira borgpetersenii serovar Hardjo-bovis]|nr:hypothetical protein B9T54_12360 [Leptospira borgpetersenii serovar Hardjo-bovis]AYR09126.1 hypothetical protein D1609_12300 [Leptospira borgpetersenii serovar Hardjo-bovis]TQE53998.1 hypothetical protein FFZ95_05550 [Leptospira borgpetersenii]TQE58244.1 hypothetical protein FFZ96_04505 [Leptospira borgpetersenii]
MANILPPFLRSHFLKKSSIRALSFSNVKRESAFTEIERTVTRNRESFNELRILFLIRFRR